MINNFTSKKYHWLIYFSAVSFSLITLIISLYFYKYASKYEKIHLNEANKCYEITPQLTISNYNSISEQEYKTKFKKELECMDNIQPLYEKYDKAIFLSQINFLIAIVFSLSFFGGIWMYKYLFPPIKN